jgi:hypothetical protein
VPAAGRDEVRAMAMLQRTFDVTIMAPPKEWPTGSVSGARPRFSNDVGREQHGIESGTVQILAWTR